MNKGNRGFLLNRFDEKDLINKINKANIAELHPLEMYAKNKNGKIKTAIAINEVSIFRETRQACLLYTSPSPRDRTRSRMPSSA